MSPENEMVVLPAERSEVALGTLHAASARDLVIVATEMAQALAGVIEQQKLYNMIQGRRHVRVEGWTTLAVMLGCTPREVSNVAQEDGSYVATVELVRMRDGAVLSRATSECGMDEPTWANRARYARRSMAATRATGKACRLAFSWIMALAGYDPTPDEEMPRSDPVEREVLQATPRSARGLGSRDDPKPVQTPSRPHGGVEPAPFAYWGEETTGIGKTSKQTFTIDGVEKPLRIVTWRELSCGSKEGRRHKWLVDTLEWCRQQERPGKALLVFMERAPIVIDLIEVG